MSCCRGLFSWLCSKQQRRPEHSCHSQMIHDLLPVQCQVLVGASAEIEKRNQRNEMRHHEGSVENVLPSG